MKRLRLSRKGSTVVAILLLIAFLSATAEQAPRKVRLKEGTFVPVRLKTSVSSEDCERDQFLDLEVVQDVKADDVVVIKGGAPARGQVETCQRSGIAGRPGTLRLIILSVKAVDEQNVPLRTAASRAGEDKYMLAIGGGLLCFPLFFQKGESTSYAAGAEFQTFTAGDKEIEVQ